ncbi:diacylglycerol/lipid kinase family protein [Nonlabens sp. Asnod3-A02]|uniref:diacylglycerol/lipid kinase family protein n=1 Tax=Nonlabens sp. Asnod3-A02 TaxID=3160579 RepID=UPI003864D504
MIKVAFLVNPISGKKGNKLEFKQINSFFDTSKYAIEIKYSSSKKHLEELTQECISHHYHIIVASGGDGTVNTVAKFLINSDIKLAILPRGSGNGLASHLGISKSLEKVCKSIISCKTIAIDCGIVNGRYFFSNFALGYPADVINRYDSDPKRGLVTYTSHSINSFFSRNENSIVLENSNTPLYCVLISNTKFMGYGLSLTPQAQVDNGSLDLVCAKSRGNLAAKLSSSILFKKNYAQRFENINIKTNENCPAQLDGEPIKLTSPYEVSVIKSCLKVII